MLKPPKPAPPVPSSAKPSVPKTVIVSLNIKGNNPTNYCSSLDGHDADLILLQRDQYEFSDFGDDYNLLGRCEEVSAFKNKSRDPSIFRQGSCWSSNELYPENLEHVYSLTVQANGISCANVLLEGGRLASKSPVYLQSNFDSLLEFKMSPLRHLLEAGKDQPDVIIGDFDSIFAGDKKVLKCFFEVRLKRYRDEYDQLKDEKMREQRTRVLRWNLDPIKLLLRAGYRHIRLQNEGEQITSESSYVVSYHVFVKKSLLDRVEATASVVKIYHSGPNAIKLTLSKKKVQSTKADFPPSITVGDIEELIKGLAV
jgi:hypothetical protein